MDAQLAGFDLAYELDSDALLKVLQVQLVGPIANRLQTLAFSVPLDSSVPSLVQLGTLQVLNIPKASLQLPATNDPASATLTITFDTALLSLDAVPATPVLGAVFAGLAALPETAIGPLIIAANVQFTSQPQAGGSLVQLALAALPPPPATAPGSQPVVAIAVPSLASLGSVASLNDPGGLAPLVETAIASAVQAAVAPIYAIPFPMTFDAPNDCGIGVRSLGVKLLAGDGGTKASLGFFLTLLDGDSGNLASATLSAVVSSADVALALSNNLLKEILCCLFRSGQGIAGLGAETSQDANCCYWRNVPNIRLGTQIVTVNELDICIKQIPAAQSSIHFHLLVEQSGWGWQAYGQFDVDLHLELTDGTIGIVQVNPEIHVWNHVSWWVWVLAGIGALIGILLGGGVAGGIVGGLIGLVISGMFYGILNALGSIAANAIGGVTNLLQVTGIGLLPPQLTQTFGKLSLPVKVDFDDLFIAGCFSPPVSTEQVSQGSDVVLRLGDSIDLDRGIIQRGNDIVPGFELEGDLKWEAVPLSATLGSAMSSAAVLAPASALEPQAERRIVVVGSGALGTAFYQGELTTLATARLVPLGAESFWSVTESALSTLLFPANRNPIPGSSFVVSAIPYPQGAYVFAVFTTEGHLAKCVAWRDSYQELHLSYVTYANPVPLAISSSWKYTRGPLVGATPIAEIYQAAWVGRLEAEPRGFLQLVSWTLPFRWLWNGTLLGASGTLPDGTTTYTSYQSGITLSTAMGTTLTGVLQVELPMYGTVFESSLDVDEPGTVRISTLPTTGIFASTGTPQPAPEQPTVPPIVDQLPAAFARGMNIPIGKVNFK